MKSLKLKSILKFILYIILSLFLALAIRLFLFNFYMVPSDSMEPTILSGDFILANKWIYGARIFTGLKFDKDTDPPVRYMRGNRCIRRDDVVVFNFPYRDRWDTIRMNLEKIFVKRCIGLPGDSVYVISGTWYIPSAGTTIALTPRNYKLYKKNIVYETKAVIRQNDSLIYLNDKLIHDYTFRTNWYFMAGDNIINSQDSRYIGLIPEAYIIGKASMVLASKDLQTGKRRWNRIFKWIK